MCFKLMKSVVREFGPASKSAGVVVLVVVVAVGKEQTAENGW